MSDALAEAIFRVEHYLGDVTLDRPRDDDLRLILAAARQREVDPTKSAMGKAPATNYADLEPFTHFRSCPALTPGNDSDCTCGLKWRKDLATERTMHAAWRKRAEECEAMGTVPQSELIAEIDARLESTHGHGGMVWISADTLHDCRTALLSAQQQPPNET